MGTEAAHFRAVICLALISVTATLVAGAGRFLVTTTAHTALNEPAAVHVHSVMLPESQVLPGAPALPGVRAAGRLVLDPSGHHAYLSTTADADSGRYPGSVYHARYHVAPFKLDYTVPLPGPPTWLAGVLPGLQANSPTHGVFIGSDGHNDRVVFASANEDGWTVAHETAIEGRIGAAITLNTMRAAAVLYAPEQGGVAVARGDAESAFLHHRILDTPPGATTGRLEPVAAAAQEDALLVVANGRRADGGQRAAWAWVLNSETLRAVAGPVALPGEVDHADGAVHVTENGCWIATRESGAGFGYVIRLVHSGTLEKASEVSLAGVVGPLKLAPFGERVAVGIGRVLELWPDGRREPEFSLEFAHPITFLQWTEAGLLVGEANRLHLVPPGEPDAASVVALQSGRITDALYFAKAPRDDPDGDGLASWHESVFGTSAADPDSDGDGLHDGADPEPLTASPRLSVPTEIAFRGEAVGKEVRTIKIEPEPPFEVAWELNWDLVEAPWLRLAPRKGIGSGVVYLGADPAWYPRGKTVEATLEISMAGVNAPHAAASPARVALRILPPARELPRILWVFAEEAGAFRAPSDPRGLRAFGDLAASAPLYFALEEHTGPVQRELDPYAIVIAEAKAITRGALVRQALLDYIADGGALLLSCDSLTDNERDKLVSWLAPFGVGFDSGGRVSGRFEAKPDHPLTRPWNHFEMRDALRIIASPRAVLVPAGGAEYGVLIGQRFGYGRIAVLGAATPLQSEALQTTDHRRFAEALLRWLARAGWDVEDYDGDGLINDIEDPANVGVVDPTETDMYDADTDGDGLPDGAEDRNRNGTTDLGETNPRAVDTDGDGIWDGADMTPYGG